MVGWDKQVGGMYCIGIMESEPRKRLLYTCRTGVLLYVTAQGLIPEILKVRNVSNYFLLSEDL